ncbi:predicted ORF [Xanthomonas phage XacN1]|nr:predicted ORF [Xanthomonas phage XacN1]
MGISTNYYVGYHVRVENKKFEESNFYLRKHCSNAGCNNFAGSISGSFCADCGYTTMESMTEAKKTTTTGLPEAFRIRNDEDAFAVFYSDDRTSIFLIPNYMHMAAKYGVLTEEFERAGITSLGIIGPFAEKFDEFRESYASFLKTLDEASITYHVEYGIVKYYY